MMLSDVAVKRPVLAAVAAIVLCVIGISAFATLPVRELPNIDPPIVSISTNYTGASAEVIESRITEVIERQVAGLQGQERITSSSRDGGSRISIEFGLDRDIDTAANDVRDAVSRVTNALPEQANAPQIAKADADASPIMILFLSAPTLNRLQLTDYAERYLVERFSTVPGVANVRIFGEQQYAMRIELDADALAARGLAVSDVEAALSSQNAELPAGYLEGQDNDFTIRVARGYATAEQFMRLPIPAGGARNTAGPGSASGLTTGRAVAGAEPKQAYVTRLGDVARVVETSNDRRRMFRGNGKDQIGLAITRQSQANDLDISEGVREAMEQVKGGLPEGATPGRRLGQFGVHLRGHPRSLRHHRHLSSAGGAGQFPLPGNTAGRRHPNGGRPDLPPRDLHRSGPARVLAEPLDAAGAGAGDRAGGRRRHRGGGEHPAAGGRGRAAGRGRATRGASGVLRRGWRPPSC
jgi:multidrug efflux pump